MNVRTSKVSGFSLCTVITICPRLFSASLHVKTLDTGTPLVDVAGLQHLVASVGAREDALKREAVRPELVEIGGEDDLPEIVQGRLPNEE